ncbi:MAG: flagellar export chaperone FliS [Phycisphaerales bacterium]|nr:flagellar export chaperone FliS [Phycisphaerales bacterium]
MAAFDPNNPYFRQQVLTASPEKLRLLLLEGCVRFMRQGRESMGQKNWEGVYANFTSSKDIILELINTMKPEVAPEVCAKVRSILTFVYNHLTQASFEKDLGKVDQCIKIMDYECETWRLLIDRVAQERGANPHVTQAMADHNGISREVAPAKPLSLSA